MALPEQLTRLLDSPFLLLARSREQRMSPGQRLWKSYAGPVLVLVGPVGLAALINSSLTREALVFTAFLAILALALRTAGTTALCVVGERQRGTLVSLALTRVDSGEYADGMALAAAYAPLRALLVLAPLILGLGLAGGADLPGMLMAWAIGFMVTLVFAYFGLLVSATSRSAQQATGRVWGRTLAFFFASPFLFVCGGFVAYPLWLLHPYFALLLALWGAPDAGPHGAGVFYLRWYALLFVPGYLWLLRSVRRRAITALERIPLT